LNVGVIPDEMLGFAFHDVVMSLLSYISLGCIVNRCPCQFLSSSTSLSGLSGAVGECRELKLLFSVASTNKLPVLDSHPTSQNSSLSHFHERH